MAVLLMMRNRSYDAGEENEISFHEGDRIVEIEAISDDWWQGKTAEGLVGLFPGMFLLISIPASFTETPPGVANYVEVQQ